MYVISSFGTTCWQNCWLAGIGVDRPLLPDTPTGQESTDVSPDDSLQESWCLGVGRAKFAEISIHPLAHHRAALSPQDTEHPQVAGWSPRRLDTQNKPQHPIRHCCR